MFLLCIGFCIFLYANSLRSVVLVRRAFVAAFLLVLLVVSIVLAASRGGGTVHFHPLSQLIYDTRVDADRWLVHATVSKTLRVAVQEYEERHHGRNPPAKFDVWYDFAVGHDSPVLDHFAQIETDISPFWGVPPSRIRESLSRVLAEPDMAAVRIRAGKVSHALPAGSPNATVLDDLVELIGSFSQHLPDMELPVNLNERPRVLATWDDLHRLNKAGRRKEPEQAALPAIGWPRRPRSSSGRRTGAGRQGRRGSDHRCAFHPRSRPSGR